MMEQRAAAAEITLGDLLAWEPRLRLAVSAEPGPPGAAGDALNRELTWAVTARATPPMLPPLRGGELVILPPRILQEAGLETGRPLPELLRDLAVAGVAAVVLEHPLPAAPLPVLLAQPIAPDLEGELNRLLTQRRGALYRAGTDLGRTLAGLSAAGADLATILAAAAEALGVTVSVVNTRLPDQPASMPGVAPLPGLPPGDADVLGVDLSGGAVLRLGPVTPTERAGVRLAAERVAVAAEAALARVDRERLRGPARAAALGALVAGSADATAVAALALPRDAAYRVALAAPTLGRAAALRALGGLGTVHDAGMLGEATAAVVQIHPAHGSAIQPLPVGAANGSPDAGAAGWIALSGVAAGPAALPAAGREARYVAALLAAGLIPGASARFDAIADLGAFQLLYPLWGSAALARFVADALGDLPAEDRRGTLRRTLLAFFETGGSHVEAAAHLGIHRNTLAYRLKQIATLTGHDPADPAARLHLHLALLAAALPEA